MALSCEVEEEIEAIEAIFGPGEVSRFGELGVEQLRVHVAPEPESDGSTCADATLEFSFPEEYPASKPPGIKVSCSSEAAAAELQGIAEQAASEGLGGLVVFAVADAVREWLRTNTAEAPQLQPSVEEASPSGEGQDLPPSDDDLDLDSEDLDGELVQALKELLRGDGEKQRELRAIGRMQGAEQRQALRAVLRSLTPAQRAELVASSSEEEQEARPAVKLPPAVRQCTEGHELSAFSARPPDYKNFSGGEYTCDVCGKDGRYAAGVYHCTRCFAKGGKQYDACPPCGQSSATAGGKKQQKQGRKKR